MTPTRLALALKKLTKILQDAKLGREAQLWYAIGLRLQRQDARHIFLTLLKRQPDNRLAFLNLGANYITSVICLEKEQIAYKKQLEEFTDLHPTDKFAHLVYALMVVLFDANLDKALYLLQKIYLSDRSYTPAISAIAAIVANMDRPAAGVPLARKAFATDPNNFQAEFILAGQKEIDKDIWEVARSLAHVRAPMFPNVYEALLSGAYFLQDPDPINCSARTQPFDLGPSKPT